VIYADGSQTRDFTFIDDGPSKYFGTPVRRDGTALASKLHFLG